MTATTSFEVTRIAGNIGAIVTGVDLRNGFSEAEADEIRSMIGQHGVLYFRGQSLTEESHVAVAQYLGELRVETMAREKAGPPQVGVISTENQIAYEAARWHTDSTSELNPPSFCVLYMQTLPPVGGDTMWSSQTAAYDALSPRIKDLVTGMTAVHGYGARHYEMNPGLQPNNTEHPVVVEHPRTGRKVLFVNPVFTQKINGLSDLESRHLLAMLFDHAVRPEFTCRWRWESGDVAIWDNPYVQHFAIHDYGTAPRKIHRVEVKGELMIPASV